MTIVMLEQIISGARSFQPETALGVTFCVILIADLLPRRNESVLSSLAIAGLLVAGALVLQQPVSSKSIFFNMFAVDAFSVFFKLVILASSLLVVLFSVESSELTGKKRPLGEYY